MQTELPWNVAGIPPEAREAARAAARREGLSVGEWLTRRIIRGQAVAGDDPEFWRAPLGETTVPHAELEPRASARDSQDMLARVARSEGETQNAYKAIDQQLKTVARRLETAERNQTENNRAMTQAATQINIAAREQTQAFEKMTANVTALAERVVRLERQAANDGVKDAIKALHQGLSRLADQIGQTASQSAEQITSLTGNIDSLASRLLETREKADATALAAEAGVASLDERMRVVERTAFSSASALDHTMENVEQVRADHIALESEVQRHAATVTEAKDAHDRLHARVSANEDHSLASIARIEEAVAQLQSSDENDGIENRLQGLEHVLSGIMERLDQAERSSAANNGGMEQTLRDLAAGFEAADKRNRDTIEEMETAVREAAAKIAAVESSILSRQAAAVEQPAAQTEPAPIPQPILDMPLFSEAEPHAFDTAPDASSPPPFPFPEEGEPEHTAPAFGEDFGESLSGMAPPQVAPEESYLSAARRAALNAAADTNHAPRASLGGFSWTFSGANKSEQPREGAKRYLMAGSIFGVAVAAALTGVVLTHGAGAPTPQAPIASKVSAPVAMYRPAPPAATPATRSAASPDDSAPDDDAVPPSRLPAPASSAAAAVNRGVTPPAHSAAAEPKPNTTAAVVAPPKSQAAAESPAQQLASLANTGDPKAQLLLGLKYLTGSGGAANEAEAARWLARAAQQGEPLAEYRLGTLYERGRGVPADQKQATHWYELAAKQGNRKAMHNLAVAYAEGTGESKNPVQAAMWFARAANLGLADSQFNLAVLYERGMGVQQSLVDAYKWYLIAAAQGDAESKKRAGALATQLSDSDRNAAQQSASAFKPQDMNPSANTPPVLG